MVPPAHAQRVYVPKWGKVFPPPSVQSFLLSPAEAEGRGSGADMAAFNIQQSMRECRINTKQNYNQENNIFLGGGLEGSMNTKREFWVCFSKKSKKGKKVFVGWKDRPKVPLLKSWKVPGKFLESSQNSVSKKVQLLGLVSWWTRLTKAQCFPAERDYSKLT